MPVLKGLQSSFPYLFSFLDIDQYNINAGFAYVTDGQDKGKMQQYPLKQNFRLPFPLAASFSFHEYNTEDKERNSGNYERNSYDDVQFFKKIAGKSDGQDCFAQVAEIFSNKFLSFRFKNNLHFKGLSLVSIGKRQRGNCGGSDGNDGLIFNARGKTLVEEIIAITGAVSRVGRGVRVWGLGYGGET
jgi:hypothetical protein